MIVGARRGSLQEGHKLGHLVRAGDARRTEVADQPVAARRGSTRHRSWYCPQRSPQRRCMPGGVQRAGAPSGLQNHRGPTGSRNESVALQEAPASGRLTAGQLGNHGTDFDDPGEQSFVPTRVETIHPTGEKGDGLAGTGQCRAVRHPIDAVGRAGDDGIAAVDQPGRCLHSYVFAIAGGRPCTDQRDRLPSAGQG